MAAPTTTSPTSTTPAPTTTVAPATATTTTRPRSTGPSSTVGRGRAEDVVDAGTSAAGPWQLVAIREAGGLLCASLRVQSRDAGQVCNEASEQDANGNDTLRYAVVVPGNGSFVIGVSRPGVVKVRAELRGGTVVERAAAAAPFTTAARFVALPLPADSVIRSLTALDSRGGVLTRITVNP